MQATGLSALQAELEAILIESAKSAATRCAAVCRERLKEEQRIYGADQIAGVYEARARLDEALASGEVIRKFLESTFQPDKAPMASKSSTSDTIDVQRLGAAWSQGLGNVVSAEATDVSSAEPKPENKIEAQNVLRLFGSIIGKIRLIESAPEVEMQSRTRSKTQVLSDPCPARILELFHTTLNWSREKSSVSSTAAPTGGRKGHQEVPPASATRPSEDSIARRLSEFSPPKKAMKELLVGNHVEVMRSFDGNSTGIMQQRLRAGSQGVVRRLDNDGDALIDFFVEGTSSTFSQWVLKKDFGNVHIKAEPSTFESRDSPTKERVPVLLESARAVLFESDTLRKAAEVTTTTRPSPSKRTLDAAAYLYGARDNVSPDKAPNSFDDSLNKDAGLIVPDAGLGNTALFETRTTAASLSASLASPHAEVIIRPPANSRVSPSRTPRSSPNRTIVGGSNPLVSSQDWAKSTSIAKSTALQASIATPQSPDGPPGDAPAAPQTPSGSAGEAARAYAARNAELGRCLAEITADLQRACIISSSCKSSLRLNSTSPRKREGLPTSPTSAANPTSPGSKSPGARSGARS